MSDLAQYVHRLEQRVVELEQRIEHAEGIVSETPARLKRRLDPRSAALRADDVIEAVCQVTLTTREELVRGGQCAFIVHARRLAAYLLVGIGKLSTPEAGIALGGRDHSTIVHHRDIARQLIKKGDELFCADLEAARRILKENDR